MTDQPAPTRITEAALTANAAKLARRLAMISDIARTALAKLEVGELLSNVALAIHNHFRFFDVSIFLVDPETSECVLVAQAGDFKSAGVEGYRQKVGVGIVGWVAQNGRTLLVNDIRQDSRHVVAFPGEENSLSELAVPIRLHDRTVGVVNIENREANAFDECDSMALETLAEQIAQAIANAQLFERTRLLRDLNRSIIDAMPSGLCVLDDALTVLYANPAFGVQFGLNEGALIGRHIRDILPGELLHDAGVEAAIVQALDGAHSRVLSGVSVKRGDIERVLNVRVTPAQMPEGLGVLTVFEDVTEWRQAMDLAEQRLRYLDLIVSHVSVAVISWDLEGRFTFWGSGAATLFGRGQEEVVGRLTPYDVFENHDLLNDLVQRCREGRAAEGELFLKRRDGARVPCLVLLGKLTDAADRHMGFTAVVLDVTERHRAEEAVRREKQKLENVVRVVGAGLVLVDSSRRVQWANPTIRSWFGAHAGAEGSNAHLICCRTDRPAANCPIDRCFAARRSSEAELRLLRADGATRHYHLAATPVLGPSGEMEQVILLLLDITDQTKKVYQLSHLRQLGELMQGVLEIDRLLHFVLTCVTAGQGLGFNRAILLLADPDRQVMEGWLGVGPSSAEEAGRIWSEIRAEALTLEDMLGHYDAHHRERPSLMEQAARSLVVPLSDTSNVLVECAMSKKPIAVNDAYSDARVRPDLRNFLGVKRFVVVPLITRNETVGVIIADNRFSGEPITEEHIELLCMFANQAALAIENAASHQRLQEEKVHLEQAYRDLADAHEKLVRAERLVAIGRMAAHIAHEIRNPLVNIGGFANVMSQRPDMSRETMTRYAEIIAGEVRRLENILRRVMDFSKPPRPLMRECAINPLILEMLDQLRERAAGQKVEITTHLPAEDIRLFMDPEQMKQVFLNLFQNALDAMKDGGLLEITASVEGGHAAIVVRNTGQPIHPEDLANLFEPFFSTKPGGTGLGLTVSQKIIQDHGGDIRCSSTLERGTEFIITLPLDHHPAPAVSYPTP